MELITLFRGKQKSVRTPLKRERMACIYAKE
jgi:hypothetical protein